MRTESRSQRPRKLLKISDGGERVCVYCGCTDSKACPGGCSWILQHKPTLSGVCSSCWPVHAQEFMGLFAAFCLPPNRPPGKPRPAEKRVLSVLNAMKKALEAA